MTSGPGIDPGPQWWEANTLTTTASMLPKRTVSIISSRCGIDYCVQLFLWWKINFFFFNLVKTMFKRWALFCFVLFCLFSLIRHSFHSLVGRLCVVHFCV